MNNNIDWIGKQENGLFAVETVIGYYFENTNAHLMEFKTMKELKQFIATSRIIKCDCYDCN